MFSGGIEAEHYHSLLPFLPIFALQNKWLASIWNETLSWNGLNCFLCLSLFISSDDAGRTGIFIVLKYLIERIKTEAVVDAYQTVKKMTQQRTDKVQTRVRINHNVAYTEKDVHIRSVKYHLGKRITKRFYQPYYYYFNPILYRWT